MTNAPSPAPRRTQAASDALARKFSSPEERSRYYREIGERGNAGRVVLTRDEASAVADAIRTLTRVAGKFEGVGHAA